MKKLNETLAFRSPELRARIVTLSDQSGIGISEIVRAAVEVGLPIIERDGITRKLTAATSGTKIDPDFGKFLRGMFNRKDRDGAANPILPELAAILAEPRDYESNPKFPRRRRGKGVKAVQSRKSTEVFIASPRED